MGIETGFDPLPHISGKGDESFRIFLVISAFYGWMYYYLDVTGSKEELPFSLDLIRSVYGYGEHRCASVHCDFECSLFELVEFSVFASRPFGEDEYMVSTLQRTVRLRYYRCGTLRCRVVHEDEPTTTARPSDKGDSA